MFHFYLTILLQVILCSGVEKNILILGGNGFIGSHLTLLLSTKHYKTTIVNRGNNYFDSKTRINPFVHRVVSCDRKTLLRETCKELLEPSIYDVVIDFSSYRDRQIEQVIDILRNKTKLYILISTDAVYEVRDKQHGGLSREEDTQIRFDKTREEQFIQQNLYGNNKLLCEERLIKQRKRMGFPFVILRLPDAIGERDTTMRWWAYQTMIKLHKYLNITIPLPNGVKNQHFSMVYAGDVAKAIHEIIEHPKIFEDEIINLAFKESINLADLLKQIGTYLKITDILFDTNDNISWFRYPSVQRGPIDIEHAQLTFDWSPTDFQTILKRTCHFFENAMIDERYAKDREIFLAEFIEELLPEDFTDDQLFTRALMKAYGPLVFKHIDVGFDVDIHEGRIEYKEEL